MNKTMKIMKVILTVLILIATVSAISMPVFADDVNPAEIANGLKGTTSGAQTQVTNIGNSIIGIITTVGVVVAVVVLLVLGIKYMMGSAQEKAEYKKTMIPYLVGAVLIFGASAITKVVISVAASISAGA